VGCAERQHRVQWVARVGLEFTPRGVEREGVAETAERVCGEVQVVGQIARAVVVL
jgi:hypothetical protein